MRSLEAPDRGTARGARAAAGRADHRAATAGAVGTHLRRRRGVGPAGNRSAGCCPATACRCNSERTVSDRATAVSNHAARSRPLSDPVHCGCIVLPQARPPQGPPVHVRAQRRYAVLIDRAVTELVGRLEARRFGTTSKPRAGGAAPVGDPSRYLPTAVRRAVFVRDEGRCRFLGPGGTRCPARRLLEFHHVEPYARGGAATVSNVQLMCRPHNALLAERDFGKAHMAAFRKNGAGPPSVSRPPPRAPSRA